MQNKDYYFVETVKVSPTTRTIAHARTSRSFVGSVLGIAFIGAGNGCRTCCLGYSGRTSIARGKLYNNGRNDW